MNVHGDVLPRKLLQEGFMIDGDRVSLLGPQGIFKPRIFELPLSITSIPDGPYDDGYSSSGQLLICIEAPIQIITKMLDCETQCERRRR